MRFYIDKNFVQLEFSRFISGVVDLDVQVAAEGFTGHENAEIFLADLQEFLRALKQFEATRVGEITLKSINPLVFQLGFIGKPNYQDLLIYGHLRSLGVEIYGELKNSLSFAFRLDQSYMQGFVNEFEEMILSIK